MVAGTDSWKPIIRFEPTLIERDELRRVMTVIINVNTPDRAWDDPTPPPLRRGPEFSYRISASGGVERPALRMALSDPDGVAVRSMRQLAWKPWEELAFRHAQLCCNVSYEIRKQHDLAYQALQRQLGLSAPGRPGRKGHDDGHYQHVAAQYQALMDSGEPHPVKILQQRMNAPRPTVSGWIKEARLRGHLGPATPGKAG